MPRLRKRKDYDGLSELFRATNQQATEQEQDCSNVTPETSNPNIKRELASLQEASLSFEQPQNWLSSSNILSEMPDTILLDKISNYKTSLKLMEIELDNRARTGRSITALHQFDNSRFRIGSLRFHQDFSREMGTRSTRESSRVRGYSSLSLSNKQYIKLNRKLKNFTRSLNLTDEERVKLLSEWEELLK